MSGYLESQLIILCLSTIYAYGIFLPAASGQLNLGAAGFITLGAYASAWFNSSTGAELPIWLSRSPTWWLAWYMMISSGL